MSPMLHSRALQTFFKTSIETFSFLPNLAKAMVLIPAFKRKSVFDISRSIKSFQSFLYDASIFSPLCLSVNTNFACNISAQKIKSNTKSVFLNIFCNKSGRLFPACQGAALWPFRGVLAIASVKGVFFEKKLTMRGTVKGVFGNNFGRGLTPEA